MAELLQEYELSVWEDVNSGTGLGNFLEKKIAVIGSHNLHTPTKAYNVTLKENVNGEKTLTFSLPRAYRDKNGELKDNPFLSFLTAERKLKLRDGAEYDFFDKDGNFVPSKLEEEDTEERWTDYVIKTIDEDKESFVNNYTCKEVYVNELGKNGWSVILDSELKNNYGTLPELAERVLEGSGWTVDKDSYVPMEKIAEPLFWVRITGAPVEATSMVYKNVETISGYVYTFYSQLQATAEGAWRIKDGLDKVQILWNGGNSFENHQLDDNRQIIDEVDKYNYLVNRELLATLEWQPTGVATDNVNAIQGGRIVESIYSHYEPVADKYVEEYLIKDGADVGLSDSVSSDAPVYHYTETEYLTSDMVKNYIVNASGYTALTGWKPDQNGPTIQTWAYNGENTAAPTDSSIDNSINYLVLPKSVKNGEVWGGTFIYNEGLKSNDFFLEPEKKYIVRVKARLMREDTGATYYNHQASMRLRLCYKVNENSSGELMTNDIHFTQTEMYGESNELVGYPKAPSQRPAAKESEVWVDNESYYCGLATIKADISEVYGKQIRFYINDTTNRNNNNGDGAAWHIEDIQLFDYVTDENGIPVYPGDIPTAKAIITDHFYTIGLENGREIVIPLSVNKDNYVPRYNANYSAVRHIDVKESNYFNNVNSLAELFGTWVKFKVKHQKNGQLIVKNGMPEKTVKFTRFASENDEVNWAGFKYGINLKSIKRNVESTVIASKVIVKNNNNEFAPAGMSSIARAIDNPTGENVIYNFDYYVAHGLLDQSTVINDLYGTTSAHFGYYYKLRELNDKLLPINEKLSEMQGALDNAKQLLEYSEVQYESASEDYNMQYTYYEQDKVIYAGSSDYDIKLAPRRKALGQLAAARNSAKKDIDIYKAQIADYEQKIYGQEWQKDKAYAKGAVVKYITTSSANYWYKSTQDNNQGEIPSYVPSPNSGATDKWELLDFKGSLDSDTIDQLPISAQADYWAEQKRQINNAFYRKYYRFIQEATWTDEKYMDDNLYYYDAVKVSAQNAWPKTKYTIGVIDVSGIERLAAYKFKVGQKSYVEDTEFFGYEYINVDGQQIKTPKKKEVVISERSRNFDDPSKSTITIQTYKNQFEELFSKLTATTQSLQYASGEYQKAANAVEADGSIKIESLEQAFANNSFMLANASNQLVTWDSGRGIEVADAKNPLEITRITSGGIYVSNDGGISWQLGLSAGRGINTRLLTAGVISTEHVNIRSKDGSNAFIWTEDGLTAFAPNGGGSKYVRFNDYGLFGTVKGIDLENAVKNAVDFDNALAAIRANSTFSLTWDGLLLNYQDGATSISPTGGLEIFNKSDTEWLFSQDYINSYTPYNPSGIPYKTGDSIPVVSVGKFYTSPGETGSDTTSVVEQYGLRMRNKDGYITLETGTDGNLWLRESLTLGIDGGHATAGINGNLVQNAFWASGVAGAFSVSHDGILEATAAAIKGSIEATALNILGSGYIGADLVIGSVELSVPEKAPFYIDEDGTLTEFIDSYIYHAAGINDSIKNVNFELSEDNVVNNFNIETHYAYWAGPTLVPQDYPGQITKEDGTTYTQYSIIQPRFAVDMDGRLIAKDVVIQGNIVATSGSFTGTIHAEDGEFTGEITAKSGHIYRLGLTTGTVEEKVPVLDENGEQIKDENDEPVFETRYVTKDSSYIGAEMGATVTEDTNLLSINNDNFIVNGRGDIFANRLFLLYRDGVRNIGDSYYIAIGNEESIFSVTNDDKKNIFSIDKASNIKMDGTLSGTGLHIAGDITLDGSFKTQDINGNTIIQISGENGGFIRGSSSGNTVYDWEISADGTAIFNNIEARGKISSVIFESNRTSAIGGNLVVAPAIYITQDQVCEAITIEDGKYRYILKGLGVDIAKVWIPVKKAHILKDGADPSNATLYDIECSVDDDEGNLYIDVSKNDIGKLTLGTQIISADELINSIKLTADNISGPRIIMTHAISNSDSSIKKQQVIIGSLGGISTDYFGTFPNDYHGLYADNAFITGRLYLPQAGITNETLEEGNRFSPSRWLNPNTIIDTPNDEIEIRFWAGASPDDRTSAPFIVTQDGSLYASKGVFKGQVIAENSSFAGTISAAGIILSHENSTDLDWEHDRFDIQWLDEVEHDGQRCEFKIASFNERGLQLFKGLEYQNENEQYLLYMNNSSNRLATSTVQVWNDHNDNLNYSSILSGQELSFRYASPKESSFENNLNAFLSDNAQVVFDILANAEGGILMGNKIQLKTKDKLQLEVTNQRVELSTTLSFEETMTIKKSADGLVFTYIGEE